MSPETPGVYGTPGRAGRFSTTHWSVVLAAGQIGSVQSDRALDQLCRTYWFPLYAYVRGKGHSAEDAQDLTQEFFARLLEKKLLSRADRQRGRFRSFLLTSMQHFLAHEWERARAEKRGGGRRVLAWEELSPESRYELEAASDLAPDKIFEQRWARALFQRALAELHEAFAAVGKSAQFDKLKRFLSAEATEGDYAQVAAETGMTPAAVAVAVHRLRRRYGQLVREQIAHTVASPAEIDDEMRYLLFLMES